MDHGELIMDLEAVLGCRVDVVSARGLRDRFRARVLADSDRLLDILKAIAAILAKGNKDL